MITRKKSTGMFFIVVLLILLSSCQSPSTTVIYSPIVHYLTVTETNNSTTILTMTSPTVTNTQTITPAPVIATKLTTSTQTVTNTVTITSTTTTNPPTTTMTTTTTISPTTTTTPSPTLITKDASQMVLTINDLGSGWMSADSGIETKNGAMSAYMSSFANAQNIYSPSLLICHVAVYPDINSAHHVYLGEVPQNVSVAHPNYGDECFYNNSVLLDQMLVFRKMNVVVWIEIQNGVLNTPYSAASSVQAKIN